MSQENVEIVRPAYRRVQPPATSTPLWRCCDPDVEWHVAIADVAGARHLSRPRGGHASSCADWLETLGRASSRARASSSTRATESWSSGRCAARGTDSGAEVEHRVRDRVDGSRRARSSRCEHFRTASRSPRSRGAVGARRSRRLLSLRDTARAMSQENVEIVRRVLRGAGTGGDLDGRARTASTPRSSSTGRASRSRWSGVYRGHDGCDAVLERAGRRLDGLQHRARTSSSTSATIVVLA